MELWVTIVYTAIVVGMPHPGWDDSDTTHMTAAAAVDKATTVTT